MDQSEIKKFANQPNLTEAEMQAYWMPFTANRHYKAAPRLFVGAEGMHYTTHDGRRVLDGVAGLWCVNAGHAREQITEAVHQQLKDMPYAPPFQMGHPAQFEAANLLTAITPEPLKHAFFTCSGSEAVDTSLKIALAYHRARGQGTRTMFIGRERGYHGVGFGGISVGGMVANRKAFKGATLPNVDHLPHTFNLEQQAFSKGQPSWGAHLADELERIVALHDASNIAAVIVEPLAGSTGVLVPPQGYLQKLREICTKHEILLIFDEVISGFGRMGEPFAAQHFGVVPDLMCVAKAINNATVPMGAVFASRNIYHTVTGTAADGAIEFFHGYTYSGHPLACAAAIATQKIYADEGLLTRVKRESLDKLFEERIHALKGAPFVRDIRNCGLVGAVELEPIAGSPGKRAFDVFLKCYERGVFVRFTGDTIAMSPPLIISPSQIDELISGLEGVLRA
jgi:beta-alanine--pyruvate transaminase